jgi:hypothetical protein
VNRWSVVLETHEHTKGARGGREERREGREGRGGRGGEGGTLVPPLSHHPQINLPLPSKRGVIVAVDLVILAIHTIAMRVSRKEQPQNHACHRGATPPTSLCMVHE